MARQRLHLHFPILPCYLQYFFSETRDPFSTFSEWLLWNHKRGPGLVETGPHIPVLCSVSALWHFVLGFTAYCHSRELSFYCFHVGTVLLLWLSRRKYIPAEGNRCCHPHSRPAYVHMGTFSRVAVFTYVLPGCHTTECLFHERWTLVCSTLNSMHPPTQHGFCVSQWTQELEIIARFLGTRVSQAS